jgi:hypothetical protein
VLWEGHEQQEEIRNLMVSLGLMIPIHTTVGTDLNLDIRQKQDEEFLVPSILQWHPDPVPPQTTRLTARAIFAVSESVTKWERSGYIDMKAAMSEVQVPDGVFSRLLGSLASLCQQTDPFPSIHDMEVRKNMCLFCLGSSSFTLINHFEYIGIYIIKGSGHEVTQLLQWQIKAIMAKFLLGFDFLLVVPSHGGRNLSIPARVGPLAIKRSALPNSLLARSPSIYDFDVFTILSGEQGIKAREKRGEGIVANANVFLTLSELRAHFGDWIMQVFAFPHLHPSWKGTAARMTRVFRQGQGGVLTEEEEARIRNTVATGRTVSTPAVDCKAGVRIVGGPSDLITGKPVETVLGLDVRLNVSAPGTQRHLDYFRRCGMNLEGIKEEISQFEQDSGESEVGRVLEYVVDSSASDGRFDLGRLSTKLSDFHAHSNSKMAQLTLAEVAALRLYTTSVYQHMNAPLRDQHRYEEGKQCPLAVTTYFACSGIKRLRALNVEAPKNRVLWRGMRNLVLTDDFMAKGGTERGFMSVTTRLELAVRYALSKDQLDQTVLLFKIVVSNFVSSGAEIGWLSAFPIEDEVLFPPLTFLKPTGRMDRFVVDSGGNRVHITVVEVEPHPG